MKIAFYIAKHGNFYDKIISFFTWSIYSHCEIIFDSVSPTYCASSSIRDGGIRFTNINFGDHWHVFELNTDKQESGVIAWFKENDTDVYDLTGAIASLFGVDLTSDNKKFCSQACAIVLGLDPIVTPKKLFNTLKREKILVCRAQQD